MKVKQFHNKNQFLIYDKDYYTFQSYDSTIATIENGELTLFKNWDYSHTTLKHLYLFLSEFACVITNDKTADIVYAILDENHNKRKAIQDAIDKKQIRYKGE